MKKFHQNQKSSINVVQIHAEQMQNVRTAFVHVWLITLEIHQLHATRNVF